LLNALALALGLAGTARGAAAPERGPLSLRQAVEIALGQSPASRSAAAGVELAQARLGEARASRLPLVQARETLTHGNNPVFVFGSLLEQGRFAEQNFALEALNDPDALTSFRTELSLRAPLFDQLQAGTRVAQARSGIEQAEHGRHLVEQRLRLEVIRTYYGVLVAEAQSQVAGEAVRTAEADVERTRQMVETGLRVESDLLAAEVQLAGLRQQQIQAAGEVVSACAALNTVLGLDAATPQRLDGALAELAFEVPGVEELIRKALERRPDYLAAQAASRSARQGVRGARGQYLPRLDGFAAYGWSGENPGSGSSDYTAGMSLTLGLFEPGRKARVDQARAQEAAAEAGAEALARQIQLEVVRARQQLVSARDRLAVALQAVGQAAEALRIVQDRYEEGLTTITEVLRAQTALLDARRGALEARYGATVGYAGVLVASGQLEDVEPFARSAGGGK
jgi:outer membrane protein TolC